MIYLKKIFIHETSSYLAGFGKEEPVYSNGKNIKYKLLKMKINENSHNNFMKSL